MRRLVLLLALTTSLNAQDYPGGHYGIGRQVTGDPAMVFGGNPNFSFGRTYRVSGNFPRDLLGPIDVRPNCNPTDCYGHADYAELPIKFNPPAGFRVRILRLRGDMIAWAINKEGKRMKGQAGILLGFSTTGLGGSQQCDWCADNTLLYIQDGLTSKGVKRTPYDWDLHDGLRLDNILVLKIAAYLNTMGLPIHIEATWQAEFEYVPI